jgi:primosomal protein N' (replication factor Y)
MNEPLSLVEVVFPLPLQNSFTYEIPAHLRKKVRIGRRVVAPLGNKILTGFIVGFSDNEPVVTVSQRGFALKEIIEISDDDPFFSERLWEFVTWAARYYIVPIGSVLKTILPPTSTKKSKRWALLTDSGRELLALPQEHLPIEIPQRLLRKGGMLLKELVAVCGEKHVEDYVSNGWFTIGEHMETPRSLEKLKPHRVPIATPPSGSNDLRVSESSPKLTADQDAAVRQITAAIDKGGFEPFLLFGVTGSGKTEVYMRVIERTLELGKEVLVLVPEIALTPQTVRVFLKRFGGGLALYHSRLTPAQRSTEWRRIRDGMARVAVAARSGIFLPFSNLGLIVVDEEHDSSYKQEDSFPYNARDLALARGKLQQTCVILGTATPSFETFENVGRGKIRRIDLPERYHAGQMPEVQIVDLKSSFSDDMKKAFLTRQLVDHIRRALSRRGQVVLYLNRRGFDTFGQCRSCGFIFRCPNCDISLTHHKGKRELRCHLCGYSKLSPPLCEQCSSPEISFGGVGTQKVEEELNRLFPSARIERLDRDSAGKQQDLEDILERFGNKQIDILTGTQMIVKGHDFPGISLVGVLYGDASLHFPDFRAGERTFQILSQVSGRTGRDGDQGLVVFQTFDTDHQAIQLAAAHAYEEFFRRECELRRELTYPPFGYLILIKIEGNSEKRVETAALKIGKAARILKGASEKVVVLGPAESPRKKVGGKFRWQVLLKSHRREPLRMLVNNLSGGGHLKVSGARVVLDVDPVDLM